MFAKYLKNKHISYFQARFCRYALPILPADLELLHEECSKLEQAVITSIASREVAQRGRADEGQAKS